LARTGLSFFLVILITGCSSSTKPTYLRANIERDIQDICKKEYKLDITAKLVGQTLWIYLPIEGILENTSANKPQKYWERFEIKDNKSDFKNGLFQVTYNVKRVPEKERVQETGYNKEALEKINDVWKVLRRIVFSMKETEAPKFFFLVTSDIQYGFTIAEIFYFQDIKKVSYSLISMTEYQHRSINQMEISPQVIGDKEGKFLNYRDIPMEEFIAMQIENRIRLKFQKPEVDKNANIDKEVLKAVNDTLEIYDAKKYKVFLNNTNSPANKLKSSLNK